MCAALAVAVILGDSPASSYHQARFSNHLKKKLGSNTLCFLITGHNVEHIYVVPVC